MTKKGQFVKGNKAAVGAKGNTTKRFEDGIIEDVLAEIASGRSLRSVCSDNGMPSVKTFLGWIKDDEDVLGKQYARACEMRADAIFEEVLEIADDGINDTYTKDGNEITNHDVIARSRLRVDARKWMLGKMRPKKYGDKVTHVGDETQPINITMSGPEKGI